MEHFSPGIDHYLFNLKTARQLQNLLLWDLTDWVDFPSGFSLQTQKDTLRLYRSMFYWTEEWSVVVTNCTDATNMVSRSFICDTSEKVKDLISRDLERIIDCPFDRSLLTDEYHSIDPCVRVHDLELI